jgi:hypothetical protein
LSLAQKPRKKEFLVSSLAETEISLSDLEHIGLVREEDGFYEVNFTLLTAEDQQRVVKVSEKYASKLAGVYVAKRAEFEAILDKFDGMDRPSVSYVLLGCFSLDWDGLELAYRLGFAAEAPSRATRDKYLVWALEKRTDFSIKGIYWGSHNQCYGDLVLTSFGDHHSLPRNGLPDLLWRMQSKTPELDKKDPLGKLLKSFGEQPSEKIGGWVGTAMTALRENRQRLEQLSDRTGLDHDQTMKLVEVLIDIQYVREEEGRYIAAIPVFAKRDRLAVAEFLSLSRSILEPWLKRNYETIEQDLGEITPLKYGVPYDEVFSQVWHYIFGITNRQLVETGFFADPYAPDRTYPGFLPAVWHSALHPSRF